MRACRETAFATLASILVLAFAGASDCARADNEPVIVVPGRPGVPVMMYGVDVSGAVIEGEWGLNRPGVVAPTVIMRYWPHDLYTTPSAYFPVTGHRPPIGRLEVVPPANRRLPPPAPTYYRDWMSQSAPGPVTAPVPYDPPPIVLAPRLPHGPHQQSPGARPPPRTP
jgi:hypothetical protein